MPRLAPFIACFLILTPFAAAVGPTLPGEGTEMVTSHVLFDFMTWKYCSSSDPVLGVVSTDLQSALTFSPPNETGFRSFSLHLDGVVGDDTCPAVDLAFQSKLDWPPTSLQYGEFVSPCGLEGWIMTHATAGSRYIQLSFNAVPGQCNIPMVSGVIAASFSVPHDETTLVCSPLVVAACAGAYDTTYDYGPSCTDGGRTIIVVGIDVASGGNHCYPAGGSKQTYVDGVLVTVYATEDDCTVYVYDVTGALPTTQSPCPPGVGDAVRDTEWGNLLP